MIIKEKNSVIMASTFLSKLKNSEEIYSSVIIGNGAIYTYTNTYIFEALKKSSILSGILDFPEEPKLIDFFVFKFSQLNSKTFMEIYDELNDEMSKVNFIYVTKKDDYKIIKANNSTEWPGNVAMIFYKGNIAPFWRREMANILLVRLYDSVTKTKVIYSIEYIPYSAPKQPEAIQQIDADIENILIRPSRYKFYNAVHLKKRF